MKRILVFAVHPDDETLGAGGTLLKLKADGAEIFWAIMTSMSSDLGFSEEKMASRKREIAIVHDSYGFSQRYEMNYPTTKMDIEPLSSITTKIGEIVKDCNPDTVIIPHKFDAHSDHNIAHKALSALSKTFRYPNIQNVWAMEVLSESNFGLYSSQESFFPNTFVNISRFLEKKVEIMSVYENEILKHPFPRSEDAIRALAILRGSESGVHCAEAFYSIKTLIR